MEEEEDDGDDDDGGECLSGCPGGQRKSLVKEGYKIIGSHSAVKLCRWTKHQLRGRVGGGGGGQADEGERRAGWQAGRH